MALLTTSPGLRPTAVQEVFDFQHPAVHALDLRKLVCPGGPLGHDRLQARQLLRTAARLQAPLFFQLLQAGFHFIEQVGGFHRRVLEGLRAHPC